MHHKMFLLLACCGLMPLGHAFADLTGSPDLLAYYNFNETGATGLANKAPGATLYHATRETYGTELDWSAGTVTDSTGPGFTGKMDFTGFTSSGISDRSTVLIGGALNLDDDRDESISVPIGTAELGNSFTISAWHSLTPGATNASNRYHVFESATEYMVSWGTFNSTFTTPQSSYQYLAYVANGPAGGFGPGGVSTGIWHHVVETVTYDGTAATIRVYLDGGFFNSRTIDITPELFTFAALNFGRARTSANDRDWDGMIDEVSIWSRALTDNEVRELFERGQAGIPVTTGLASVGKAFIDVSPATPDTGETLGAGLYDMNEVALIDAYPEVGYVFAGWTGGFNGETDSFDHTVTASVTSQAVFVEDSADDDSDGLTNYQELVIYHTDPNLKDSDGDLVEDGDEINTTMTDPNVSQLAAVNYIINNISNGAGPNDIVLTRDSGTDSVTLHLAASGSTTLQGWSAINPNDAGVSTTLSGGDFKLALPGTADAKRFFRLAGNAPTE